MRMSGKMILLFSVVTAALITVNTVLSIQTELRTLQTHEAENLTVIADQMCAEIEQNISIMEYGIEEMTQNSEFMYALYTIYRLGESGEHTEEYRQAQTFLSKALYQQPLNDHYYSVNVLTGDGFIISSHFQKFDIIESYSDEFREQLDKIFWMNDDSVTLNVMQVVTPHPDPWNVYRSNARSAKVYTVWSRAVYHGQEIGYLEVSASIDELDSIFSISGLNGFQAAAIFENRTNALNRELYRADSNTLHYENIVPGEMLVCKDEDGLSYYVAASYSKALDLTVYAAIRTDVHANSVQSAILHHLLLGLLILAFTVTIIILLSMGLTRSIRLLTKKISRTGDMSLLAERSLHSDYIKKITSPHDLEVREMENSFDDLLITLQESTRTEVDLRESTLRAQLNALQAQINPHFVYNTLNIISAKSMEAGNEEIIDICDHFAHMLRYSTDLQSKTATLADEIENARNYLLIAKTRYESKLTYTIDIPDQFLQQPMPKLSLQPIIENAISHGYQGSKGSIHIEILGHIDEKEDFHLIIRDNGAGFNENVLHYLRSQFVSIENGEFASAENTTAHIGLVNTYRRLYYFSRKGINMLLRNDGGAVIELIVHEKKKEG